VSVFGASTRRSRDAARCADATAECGSEARSVSAAFLLPPAACGGSKITHVWREVLSTNVAAAEPARCPSLEAPIATGDARCRGALQARSVVDG